MIDPKKRERAIKAARDGMSLEGIAHLCGVTRMSLWRWRTNDPSLDEDIMAALAEYEWDLLKTVRDALDLTAESPQAAIAAAAQRQLAQRFPQRHGADPRLRLDMKRAQEGRVDDLAEESINPATQTPATIIASLVERMLTEDEGTNNADDR